MTRARDEMAEAKAEAVRCLRELRKYSPELPVVVVDETTDATLARLRSTGADVIRLRDFPARAEALYGLLESYTDDLEAMLRGQGLDPLP